MSYYSNRCYWPRKAEGFPYTATTSTAIKPAKKKYGECVSATLSYGTRTWAFKTVAARDKFVDITGGKRVFSDHEKRELGMIDRPRYNPYAVIPTWYNP